MTSNIFTYGVIYKIQCISQPEILYVGSTTNLKLREQTHKHSYKNNKFNKIKLYKSISNYGGWGNFKFEEVEEVIYKNRLELLEKEEIQRIKLKANLNTKRAHHNIKEISNLERADRKNNLLKLLINDDELIKMKLSTINKGVLLNIEKIELIKQLEKELKIDRFNFTKKEPDEYINININLIKLINYIFRSNQNPKTFNDAIDYYQKKLYHLIEQQGVLITERKYSSIYQKKIFNHSINYEKLNIELNKNENEIDDVLITKTIYNPINKKLQYHHYINLSVFPTDEPEIKPEIKEINEAIEENKVVLNEINEKIEKYKIYKQSYNKARYESKKEEFKYRAHKNYISKLENDPEYRQITRDRANKHRIKKIIENGKIPSNKKGRPKDNKIKVEKIKKKQGRPRIYFTT